MWQLAFFLAFNSTPPDLNRAQRISNALGLVYSGYGAMIRHGQNGQPAVFCQPHQFCGVYCPLEAKVWV